MQIISCLTSPHCSVTRTDIADACEREGFSVPGVFRERPAKLHTLPSVPLAAHKLRTQATQRVSSTILAFETIAPMASKGPINMQSVYLLWNESNETTNFFLKESKWENLIWKWIGTLGHYNIKASGVYEILRTGME